MPKETAIKVNHFTSQGYIMSDRMGRFLGIKKKKSDFCTSKSILPFVLCASCVIQCCILYSVFCFLRQRRVTEYNSRVWCCITLANKWHPDAELTLLSVWLDKMCQKECLKGKKTHRKKSRFGHEIKSWSFSITDTATKTPLHPPGTHSAGSNRQGHPPWGKQQNGPVSTSLRAAQHNHITAYIGVGGGGGGWRGVSTLTVHPITLNHDTKT